MEKKFFPLFALLTVILTVGIVWSINHPAPVTEASWQDVLKEAESGGYRILTTDEVADLYADNFEGLLLVDTRQEWEYRSGHIQGAVNFPMEPTWWARWRKASKLEDFLGPDKKRKIVFY
jgi:predicted sulfurtransferase